MDAQNSSTFSIVVPLFNEEENVRQLVEKILAAVGAHPRFLEIILVDDGSRDRTANLVSELAVRDERIRLAQHQVNRGLGAAIRTGLNTARGDFALYTDADLPFDFDLIPQLFALADEGRVVAGCRLNRGEGLRRLLLTRVYNFLVRALFGLRLKDVNFACKIFPRRFLDGAELNADGSFIDVEMLVEARRLGLEIYSQPLRYLPRERGLSTLSRPVVILYIFKEMLDYAAANFSNRVAAARNAPPVREALELSPSE